MTNQHFSRPCRFRRILRSGLLSFLLLSLLCSCSDVDWFGNPFNGKEEDEDRPEIVKRENDTEQPDDESSPDIEIEIDNTDGVRDQPASGRRVQSPPRDRQQPKGDRSVPARDDDDEMIRALRQELALLSEEMERKVNTLSERLQQGRGPAQQNRQRNRSAEPPDWLRDVLELENRIDQLEARLTRMQTENREYLEQLRRIIQQQQTLIAKVETLNRTSEKDGKTALTPEEILILNHQTLYLNDPYKLFKGQVLINLMAVRKGVARGEGNATFDLTLPPLGYIHWDRVAVGDRRILYFNGSTYLFDLHDISVTNKSAVISVTRQM